MSARFARNTFTSAARRAQAYGKSAATRVSRRAMSSTSHGAEVKSSDTPWIIGSALIFGPAFLYLVSPSARKNTAHIHDDKHSFPTLKSHEEHAAEPAQEATPQIMKDDEGTPADVGASIAQAEADDVPQGSGSPETPAVESEAKEALSTDAAETSEPEPKEESPEAADGQKSGTFQKEGEEGPTDLSKAQEAAQSGVAPKQAAEGKN